MATSKTTTKNDQLDADRVKNSAPNSYITTNFGVRIANTDTSLKAGERGPTLLEDFHFREKISHFDHERIPERVVHARGTAAHGYFQVYQSLEHLTKAGFLCDPSRKTPVFTRFSTVLGSRGSADTVRDVRGFAVRLYTDEGNFDLVGNNIPVFFIQDAIKFPDIIHAGKPEPQNEIPQGATAHDNFWDFMGLVPESAHMSMWILSDRTVPRSLRMMEGFGVHTFELVDKHDKRRFVKFHWKPKLGVHSLPWDESQKLGGQDPDFHRRDLWEAIETGFYPEWELGLQIIEANQENDFDFDILDPTKLIPEELIPVQIVGKMVLNRNPTDFFAETEQVAFCTQHVVPGIDFSDDPLLQGRNFSYADTQLTRLGGPNFMEIPINRPLCPVMNNQRDGFMRQKIQTDTVNYFPNRHGWPRPAPESEGGFVTYAEKIAGIKERARGPKFADHYSQATLFYNSLSDLEKDRLIATASFELGKCTEAVVKQRMLESFAKIDSTLCAKVAAALGMDAPAPPAGWVFKNKDKKSPAVSMDNHVKYPVGDITTCKVAILVADGFDAPQVTAMCAALKAKGAIPSLVAPRGVVKDGNGASVKAHFTILTVKSTLFDAVFIPGGKGSASVLSNTGDYIYFVNESYKHFKPVVAIAEGEEFIRNCCVLPGVKFGTGDDVVVDKGVVTAAAGSATDGVVREFIKALGERRFWGRDVSKVPA